MAASNLPAIRGTVAQVGIETTPGTPVATTRIADTITIEFKPTHSPILVGQAGDYSENVKAYPGLVGGQVILTCQESFDDAPYWDNTMGVPVLSGTGGAAPYTYAITPSKTDPTSRKALTIEVGGISLPAWPNELMFPGCVLSEREISWDKTKGGLIQDKLTFVAGGLPLAQAKTGALSARTSSLQHIPAQLLKAYLNDTGSAFGATQLVARAVSGSIKWVTGADPLQTMDGTGAPSMVADPGPWKSSGNVRVHFSSMNEYTQWMAATALRLRVEAVGPVLSGGNWKRTHDLGIILQDWKPVNDRGMWKVDLPFVGIEDSSISSQLKLTTLNNSSSVAA